MLRAANLATRTCCPALLKHRAVQGKQVPSNWGPPGCRALHGNFWSSAGLQLPPAELHPAGPVGHLDAHQLAQVGRRQQASRVARWGRLLRRRRARATCAAAACRRAHRSWQQLPVEEQQQQGGDEGELCLGKVAPRAPAGSVWGVVWGLGGAHHTVPVQESVPHSIERTPRVEHRVES